MSSQDEHRDADEYNLDTSRVIAMHEREALHKEMDAIRIEIQELRAVRRLIGQNRSQYMEYRPRALCPRMRKREGRLEEIRERRATQILKRSRQIVVYTELVRYIAYDWIASLGGEACADAFVAQVNSCLSVD